MSIIQIIVLVAAFVLIVFVALYFIQKNSQKNLKSVFDSLSMEALSRNTEEFLKLAREMFSHATETNEMHLSEKKKLIDQTLEEIKKEMERVRNVISDVEKGGEKKFGEVSSYLKSATDEMLRLRQTADELKTVLSGSSSRGQWGERMAEDVLRLAGFVEGINYLKQNPSREKSRPDYTFLLPQGMKVNMDVKFPFDNYFKYVEAENEAEKETYKKQFLSDVKTLLKDVLTRDYINPQENTLDYVIVFIPNEQVYSFINENDSEILDWAIQNKIMLCSPITLYAILSIIRSAMDNFNLSRSAVKILEVLDEFQKQWVKFTEQFEKMGKKIEEVQSSFDEMAGVRKNKLEKTLEKLEDLRGAGLES